MGFLFNQINWLWLAVAVVVAYLVGWLWYGKLFAKEWMAIFKVEAPEKMSKLDCRMPMLIQLIASAIMGIVLFMLTILYVWLAVAVLVAFCAWDKAMLKFQFFNWKTYYRATLINVGYTGIMGVIFILFALI